MLLDTLADHAPLNDDDTPDNSCLPRQRRFPPSDWTFCYELRGLHPQAVRHVEDYRDCDDTIRVEGTRRRRIVCIPNMLMHDAPALHEALGLEDGQDNCDKVAALLLRMADINRERGVRPVRVWERV
jgi:hypothetical protein